MSRIEKLRQRIDANAARLKALPKEVDEAQRVLEDAKGRNAFQEAGEAAVKVASLRMEHDSATRETRALLAVMFAGVDESSGVGVQVPSGTTIEETQERLNHFTAQLEAAQSLTAVPDDIEKRLRAHVEDMCEKARPTVLPSGEVQWAKGAWSSAEASRNMVLYLLGADHVFERVRSCVPSGVPEAEKADRVEHFSAHVEHTRGVLEKLAWHGSRFDVLADLYADSVSGHQIDAAMSKLLQGRPFEPPKPAPRDHNEFMARKAAEQAPT